jgi:hypothetical protein
VVVGVSACHHWMWAFLREFAARSKEITGGLFTSHTEFQPTLEAIREYEIGCYYSPSAHFIPTVHWCFMLIGGIEFAVFS